MKAGCRALSFEGEEIHKGALMRRLLCSVPLLFVLLSGSLLADSITIMGFAPNDGSGDNFYFYQKSGGTTTGVGGGTSPDFFNAFGYAPGSTLGGGADVFFYSAFIQVGGEVHDLDFDSRGFLFMSGVTLPTNGVLKVTFPVELDFQVSGTIADTGQPISISGFDRGKMTFTLDSSNGLYYAGPFVHTTPEPGTLTLIATGITAIVGRARRRLLRKVAPTVLV